MKYCKVLDCNNFKGGNVHMFIPPEQTDWLELWNSALCAHKCSNGRLVCIEHFQQNDYYIVKGKQLKLKKFAIPTIFNKVNEESNCAVEILYENEEINPLEIQLTEAKELIKTMELNQKRMFSSCLSKFVLNVSRSQDAKVSFTFIESLRLGNLFKEKYNRPCFVFLLAKATRSYFVLSCRWD